MLLTDNIVVRYLEWRDRRTETPDLVPRMRRLWKVDRVEPARHPRGRRRLLALRHRATLEVSRGA
jgi:hypothetical protein